MRYALALAVCAFTAAVSSAQYGNLTHNFFGPAGTQNRAFPAAVTSASTVTFGSGVGDVATVNMINTNQWTNAGSPDVATDYYAFSFLTNQTVSVPSVTVNALATAQGPKMMDLRSSLDGFTATLGTLSPTTTAAMLTYTLPSGTFGNLPANTNLEFRLYGYVASNSGTNSQLGFISPDASTMGITVPIAAPIPEPVSVLGVATLGLAACGVIRRRGRAC